ncbi:MAG: T9SS type A sorting domain-containing protein [Chlorobi bacterium]|nr:T9SS type A sorting domain-containing protein [Chlorobiota bacterium]
MKKITIVLLLLITCNLFAQNQPILSTSEDFENWEKSSIGEMPKFWDGFNKPFIVDNYVVDSVITVTKDSLNPQSGNYSVKLQSKDFFGVPIQGLLTHGKFDVDFINHTGDITGGIPTHNRPLKFKGYYKYFPANSDIATISIWFMKGPYAEKIGEGKIEISQTVATWTEFVVDIQYYTDDEPDTMNVLFTTSSDPFNIQVGSVLEIDNISLEQSTSYTPEIANSNLSVFPNPANNFVQVINPEISGKSTLKIINTIGEVLITKTFYSTSGFNENIDLNDVPGGIYFIELSNIRTHSVKKLIVH